MLDIAGSELRRLGLPGAVLLVLLALLGRGWVPTGQRAALVAGYDELVRSVARIQADPAGLDGCADVGSVRGKLYTDVGHSDAPDVWLPLRGAVDALLAACGQRELLARADATAPITSGTRTDWQSGAAAALVDGCERLAQLGPRLGRDAPGCPARGVVAR